MMKSIKQNVTGVFFAMLALVATVSLSGCGADGPATTTVSASSAATISLSTTATSVKSDGSSSVTITATALTASNAIVSGQILTFSASTGILGASTGTTDATGQVKFTFSAGPSGLNRTATITATATGSAVTASIPIQIVGSTLTLKTTTTTAVTGTAIPITITATDASSTAVPSQSLTFSVANTSTGSGTLSAATGTTDANGQATVSVTGTAGGKVDVLVQWLDASSAITASSTITIDISGTTGGAFQITTPASSPFPATIGTTAPYYQTVTVTVPPTIGTPGVAVAQIRYATTMGTWQSGGLPVLTVARTGATDTQSFVPGANAGNASVQIDALSSSGAVLATANLIFSITAPATAALTASGTISLQSNVTGLAPSSGSTQSTATLTATVTDGGSAPQPVGGAAVLFQLVNSTGTGETISPVVTMTSTGVAPPVVPGAPQPIVLPPGQAQAIFTAGSSNTQYNQIKASIVGATGPASSALLTLTVGGTAGSIAFGVSSGILSDLTKTYYNLPVTVFVTDSRGASVSGAVVSLSLWPKSYIKGYRSNTLCGITWVGPFLNEDTNRNLILDAGEDGDGPGGFPLPLTSAVTPYKGVPDVQLWPSLASAGAVPATVTTDANGRATFTWSYLKQYADWLKATLTATTRVQGTESIASTDISLVSSAEDNVTPCPLPHSPFN